jgi:hypothetical protein
MTVKELKEMIATYPDDMLVAVEENGPEYRVLDERCFNAKTMYSPDKESPYLLFTHEDFGHGFETLILKRE